MMREPPYPEIYCDFNARMSDRGYHWSEWVQFGT
jgi:hypothetical protein